MRLNFLQCLTYHPLENLSQHIREFIDEVADEGTLHHTTDLDAVGEEGEFLVGDGEGGFYGMVLTGEMEGVQEEFVLVEFGRWGVLGVRLLGFETDGSPVHIAVGLGGGALYGLVVLSA